MTSHYDPRYESLIKKLRQARQACGLTQMDVAREMNWDQSLVSKIETKRRRIDPIELSELAKLYDKPVSFFFPNEGHAK